MSRSAPDAPWTLVYADGAANQHRLAQEGAGDEVSFEYVPVTPAQSSSGRYSGGPSRQARLAADDPRIAELWRRVAALAADPSLHDTARTKGSGAFTVISGAGTQRFIVMRGEALDALDALLRRFGG